MNSPPQPASFAAQTLWNAVALPAAFYVHPDALQLELRAVFSRSWQLLAHVSQLAGAGDHVIGDIAGVPLLLVRGEDGEIRALHNVCRHRAGPLATCDGRGARSLRCRYHGWTYGLDGQLRHATDMAATPGFDPGSIALGQASVALWRGLVFVALAPAVTFADFIAQVDARIGAMDFSQHVFERRVPYEADCNWKVYVDNYLEGYHLPHVHPGLNSVLDYRSYSTETGHWHSLQTSALDGSEVYASGEALYFFLWPNTMLNLLPDRLQTNRVVPLAPDRCRIDFDYSYPAASDSHTGTDARALREQALREQAVRQQASLDQAFSDQVQQEDALICAAVQRGLASGVYQPGRLHPVREQGVFHFHEHVRRIWREAHVAADADESAATPAATAASNVAG